MSPATEATQSPVMIPSGAFGKYEPRIIKFMSGNVTASLERTAKLRCRIQNLGQHTVINLLLLSIIKLFFQI